MKRSNVFIQSETYSCGACCIESIVSYYGGYVPHETVLKDTLTNTNGTNAYNIIRALKKYGFASYGFKTELASISALHLPLIAHVIDNGYEHFIVIYKIDKSQVFTMNPRVGYKVYKKIEFEKLFDNIIITAKPIVKVVKYNREFTPKKLYSQLVKNNYHYFFTLFILNCIFIFLSLIGSLYLKAIQKTNHIYYFMIMFIILIFLKYATFIAKDLIKRKVSMSMDKVSNASLIKKIYSIDPRYIINKRSGELLKKVVDLSVCKDILVSLLTDTVMDVLLLVISTIMLLTISTLLALIAISSIFVISLLFFLFNREIYYRELDYNDNRTLYQGDFTEYTSSIESIKNLHKENYFIDKLSKSFERLIKSRNMSENFQMNFTVLKSIILDIYYIVIITIGVSLIVCNKMQLVDLFIFNSIYSLMNTSLFNIINFIYDYFNNEIIIRDLCEVYNINETKCICYSGNFQILKIDNLSLAYNMMPNVISNFSKTIKCGDKVLLTGDSGAGKSSLAKCISGLIKDYSGNIYIDNKPNIFYSKIVYVGQNESIFTGTVKDNITFKDNENSFKEIYKLCELDGQIPLDKYVSNGEENISKGEKARIILARALYAKPEILIIDELLSNVSFEVENKILSSLLKIEKLTLIYITHRDRHEMFKNIIKLERNDNIGTK